MAQPLTPDQAGELVSLNAADLAVEELEQRLELALALAPIDVAWKCGCDCPELESCGEYCSRPPKV